MTSRHVPTDALGAWERPERADRSARSDAIERRIVAAAARIADPELRRLLEGTLPNTLDTTVIAGGPDKRPDTFIATRDIDAMWLRDSTPPGRRSGRPRGERRARCCDAPEGDDPRRLPPVRRRVGSAVERPHHPRPRRRS